MTTYLEFFPSKYLRADELENDIVTATTSISVIELEGKKRLECRFAGVDKSLILNKTNADALAAIAKSPDYNNWGGLPITITVLQIPYRGEQVAAIRLKPVRRTSTIQEALEKQRVEDAQDD